MTIVDDWIVLDTNAYIFGIREDPNFPACTEMLERIGELRICIPRQIIRELQSNLRPREVHELFGLFKRYPDRVRFSWKTTTLASIEKFQRLGCKLGDATVAAHLEEEGVKVLVSENRHFLAEIHGLPFRVLNATEALEELGKIH
jgi:predicted nucleic acid-binding protein